MSIFGVTRLGKFVKWRPEKEGCDGWESACVSAGTTLSDRKASSHHTCSQVIKDELAQLRALLQSKDGAISWTREKHHEFDLETIVVTN